MSITVSMHELTDVVWARREEVVGHLLHLRLCSLHLRMCSLFLERQS